MRKKMVCPYPECVIAHKSCREHDLDPEQLLARIAYLEVRCSEMDHHDMLCKTDNSDTKTTLKRHEEFIGRYGNYLEWWILFSDFVKWSVPVGIILGLGTLIGRYCFGR